MINSKISLPNIFSVLCDEEEAVAGCIEEFYNAGHRNIALAYNVETYSGMKKYLDLKRVWNYVILKLMTR